LANAQYAPEAITLAKLTNPAYSRREETHGFGKGGTGWLPPL
jgi:hypothetical protein